MRLARRDGAGGVIIADDFTRRVAATPAASSTSSGHRRRARPASRRAPVGTGSAAARPLPALARLRPRRPRGQPAIGRLMPPARRLGLEPRRPGRPAASAARPGTSRSSPRATWRTACAAGSSASVKTSGSPASACSRSGIVSGTLPSSGTSSSSASSWPPPSPKSWKRSPDGRDEAGHVLDDAGDLEVDLVGHLGRAARDLLGGRLRRRDEQEPRLREQLGERHRDVAGPRGQVDEQEVQLAPGDVLEELGQRLVEHRPAPDDGGVLLDEEPDRHDLDAAGRLQRHDLALGRDRRAAAATPNMRGIE